MSQLKTLLFPVLALAAVGLLQADTPGRHPFYLHARSDLRAAQWVMRGAGDPDVMRRLHQADVEIDAAIREMDQAAAFDRKNLNDHPPIDQPIDRRGRFQKAMELLQRARADIGREEDNPSAVGWRNLAYQHIDGAIAMVKRAARDLRLERDLGW